MARIRTSGMRKFGTRRGKLVWFGVDFRPWFIRAYFQMRELCERALSRVGLHVADGRLLWDAYRVLEGALSEASRTADTPPDTDRLFHLYKRQLSIPLMGLEETRQVTFWYSASFPFLIFASF